MKENDESLVQNLESNVSFPERVISIMAGSFLMCSALSRKWSIPKALVSSYLLFRGTTGYCPCYHVIGKGLELKGHNININTSLTVNKPPSEVYAFWRRLENLPLFMEHLESVKQINDKVSEWKVKFPGGLGTVGWKSEIVEDVPNERISWHSVPDSTIENAGNVHFLDAGKFGTELQVYISYRTPAGRAGEGLGRLLNPVFEQMVRDDIKSFRSFLESDTYKSTEE